MIFYAVFLSFSTVAGHDGVNLCRRQGFKGREKENANALKTAVHAMIFSNKYAASLFLRSISGVICDIYRCNSFTLS